MKALVLDFDGVISDSAREAFVVSRRTWDAMRPGNGLAGRDEAALHRAFLELMPLGNRAEDYGVARAAIEGDARIGTQEEYDRLFGERDAGWLRRFHERFYRERAAWARRDRKAWLAAMRPYPPVLELARRRAGDALLAIATAKDRRSVAVLRREYGIDDLFPDGRVLDKETGVTKVAHLAHLRDELGPKMLQVRHLGHAGLLVEHPTLWKQRVHAVLAQQHGDRAAVLRGSDRVGDRARMPPQFFFWPFSPCFSLPAKTCPWKRPA